MFAIQNTHASGYSAFDLINAGGTTVGGFGFGNGSTSAQYANNVYVASTGATPLVLVTGNTERLRVDSTGKVGIGAASVTEKLEVTGNIKVTGQVYTGAQTSSDPSPLTFDTNSGTTMVWTTAAATATVNVHNMKAGGTYMLVVSGTGTGTITINCFSGAGTSGLPASFQPTNGTRVAGVLNKTVYTLMSDGTNCLATWITGF
ncbi:MAG: hypothetical protein V4692_08575 [Bdellovibrionota bacterium]